jgi:hypothetical protein
MQTVQEEWVPATINLISDNEHDTVGPTLPNVLPRIATEKGTSWTPSIVKLSIKSLPTQMDEKVREVLDELKRALNVPDPAGWGTIQLSLTHQVEKHLRQPKRYPLDALVAGDDIEVKAMFQPIMSCNGVVFGGVPNEEVEEKWVHGTVLEVGSIGIDGSNHGILANIEFSSDEAVPIPYKSLPSVRRTMHVHGMHGGIHGPPVPRILIYGVEQMFSKTMKAAKDQASSPNPASAGSNASRNLEFLLGERKLQVTNRIQCWLAELIEAATSKTGGATAAATATANVFEARDAQAQVVHPGHMQAVQPEQDQNVQCNVQLLEVNDAEGHIVAHVHLQDDFGQVCGATQFSQK